MQNIFETYIKSVTEKFSHAETSEMGYRADFEILLKNIFEEIKDKRIVHDPRVIEGNKPDFIVMKGAIPILYIEAKDIGVSLDKIEKSEQMTRYFGYANLILTDYVEFRFYRNGLKYEEPIKIAEYDIKRRRITPVTENYEHLKKSFLDFTQAHKEPIRTAEHLAKIMGGKAQRIRDNVRYFLSIDSAKNKSLLRLYETIKKMLVHDLTNNAFADLYAQTLVYGLFVARYHDESPDNFNRLEARELVPKSNPLLRHFFDHILGTDYDERLKYIVDELCEVFTHADVQKLMQQYIKNDLWGKQHEGPDPVIHFYEDFLKEYDPELRKKMGAYYTPLPVVRFIVRAVDYILEKDFGLANGLADTSKSSNGLHTVQILDPATGTGTFITEIFKNIYTRFKEQKGRWPQYVFHDLLPRVHGFELMMAPYTIAHLKLSMFLKDTGFTHFNTKRLGIYLTNSLEETKDSGDLFTSVGFAESIAQESKDAAVIKDKTPIMVVIGNPPYNISSSNKSEWILNQIEVYKRGLTEQNINALSDDYVKFIRFAEYFIEKNCSGIIAMITNHAFIDGITQREMRKHLLDTFDDIYIVDLHGNAIKKEISPDGSVDENIFNIKQGVSISIFVRKNLEKSKLGEVSHIDIYGKQKDKFKILDENNINNIKWHKIKYARPYYFFVPKNFQVKDEYDKGIKIDELFMDNGSGIKFRKDNLLVKNHFCVENVEQLLKEMNTLDSRKLFSKYNFIDTTDWKLVDNRKYFIQGDIENIKRVNYRPFDKRYTYYPLDTINKIIPRGDSRKSLMKNLFQENWGIITGRQGQVVGSMEWNLIYISKDITDMNIFYRGGGVIFPLFIYNEDGTKISNIKSEIVKEIEKITDKTTPVDILDYIYAVLHSPSYRVKYKEFLKIDFPRVPYPKDKKSFKELVKLGTELRLLHLLESPKVNKFITTYPIEGTDTVEKIAYKNGNVFINTEQFFGKVPETAWNFYIGGYQPAQKWLKDRKGRTLTNEDIEHYQKIIVSLTETDRIMKEIDKVYSKLII